MSLRLMLLNPTWSFRQIRLSSLSWELTLSLQRPFKPAILFPTADRRTSEHAFRFLRVLPVAVSIHHSWLWQIWDDVYTRRCFSESEGTRFSVSGQKALPSMNEFTLLWIFASSLIHDLFRWRSSHKFVKTDLYPLSLMSLWNAVCSIGCGPIIGKCFGACNGTSCVERRPQ